MATVTSVPRVSGAPELRASAERTPTRLVRFFRALRDAQARRGEALAARYIELHGGRVTDSLERDIDRRFGAR